MKRQAETSERSTPQKKTRASEGLERLSEMQKTSILKQLVADPELKATPLILSELEILICC